MDSPFSRAPGGSRFNRCKSGIRPKQRKMPRTKVKNLIKMGIPKDLASQAGNSRRGYWYTTQTAAINMAMTKERLINRGFYDLAAAYQSVHVNY